MCTISEIVDWGGKAKASESEQESPAEKLAMSTLTEHAKN
jgi:hypothetical protein